MRRRLSPKRRRDMKRLASAIVLSFFMVLVVSIVAIGTYHNMTARGDDVIYVSP